VDRGSLAPDEVTSIPAWAQIEVAAPTGIAGRVVSGGKPVRGARLRLSSGMLAFTRHLDRHAVSDASGAFSFGAQAATNWFLSVTAAGLEPGIWYLEFLSVTAAGLEPGI
jgi:hypothetical protein